MQEQSKKLVTGKLKEVAYQKIDEQTEALVSMIGDNQVDYRFFLGFKLMVTEEQLNLKNIKKSAWLTFTEFLHEVNHTLMNDFVSMPNDEINRYMKMEKLLENKISRRVKVRRLEIHDFGYLMEHLSHFFYFFYNIPDSLYNIFPFYFPSYYLFYSIYIITYF